MFTTVFGGLFESEWFPAQITGVGAAVTDGGLTGIPHAWTRLTPARRMQTNAIQAGIPTKSGTVTDGPAFSVDGSAANVGDKVLMRFYGLPYGMPAYQFIAAPATISGGLGAGGAVVEVGAQIVGQPFWNGWLASREGVAGTSPTVFTRGEQIYIYNLDNTAGVTNSLITGSLLECSSFGNATFSGTTRKLYATHAGLVKTVSLVTDVYSDFGTTTVTKRVTTVRS